MIVERLLKEQLGPDVMVEDLFFGALAVCQRLEELRPEAMILVGAAVRGRAPGSVLRREVEPMDLPIEELQHAVGEAATGYVSIDLVLEVATAFHALPDRAIVFEIEPETTAPGDTLSPAGESAVELAIELIKREVSALAPAPH
ncbi:MAG: hypothetical protein M3077_11110 [Candidatus Dormibacteraeota bacterium]|nr:hypothetical protein [Candidatus Dormibacteraeota bacterium]